MLSSYKIGIGEANIVPKQEKANGPSKTICLTKLLSNLMSLAISIFSVMKSWESQFSLQG